MGTLDKQIAIVREFMAFDAWEERYKHLIKIGRELPELSSDQRTDDAKVRGCSSSVWLHASLADDGTVKLEADSDALLVRGLVALLLRVYSNETPATIIATEPMFIEELDLAQHLSATRANGLASMIKQIKTYAVGLQAQSN